MTSSENAAFYRDVLGMPAEVAERVDDVAPDLVAVTPEEADEILDAAGVTIDR